MNWVSHIDKIRVVVAAVFLFSVIISPLVTNNVFAASLTQSFVRFDRMKISTATTGTVCAKPATALTEATVVVSFPTGYTLGAAGTFTVNTTNLAWPTGATAWLGINTATTVSSQDVTFPSSDLVVGTLYCFNWASTSAVTTKSSASSSNPGAIATYATGPTLIDSAAYSTATIADDQIVVTATVPQTFSFALSGNTDPLGALDTSLVKTSVSPRTVTVNTNAKNGWQVWAKSAYQGLCSPSLNTCTPGTPTTNLPTSSVGNNRLLTAGSADYATGVTASQAGGNGTLAVSAVFDGTITNRGGGLSATALQSLASSNGTANAAVLTLKNNVTISAITPAAADYTDTITVIGAGLF